MRLKEIEALALAHQITEQLHRTINEDYTKSLLSKKLLRRIVNRYFPDLDNRGKDGSQQKAIQLWKEIFRISYNDKTTFGCLAEWVEHPEDDSYKDSFIKFLAKLLQGQSNHPELFSLLDESPKPPQPELENSTSLKANNIDNGIVIVVSNNIVISKISQAYKQTFANSDEEQLKENLIEYLRSIRNRSRYLELRGIKRGENQLVQLDIEEAYVPLEAMLYRSDTNISDKKAPDPTHKRIAMNKLLAYGKRLVITGGPGSGKTTVLLNIQYYLCKAILTNKPKIAIESLGLPSDDIPIPVMIPLNAYAHYRNEMAANPEGGRLTIAGFIQSYLTQRLLAFNLPENFFRWLIESQRKVILLLDGLDEIPNEDERAQVRQDIQDLVNGRESIRAIVTCRTAAYHDRTVLEEFDLVNVAHLDADAVKTIIKKAYDCIFGKDDPQSLRYSDNLIKGLVALEEDKRRKYRNIRELVSNPLLVKMLLIVHYSERHLPEQRAELYMRSADAILYPTNPLDEEVAQRIKNSVAQNLETQRDMFQRIAYALHKRGQLQGREISLAELEKILKFPPAYESAVITQLIDSIRFRGSIMEETNEKKFRFVHPGLQEYLVARYLAEVKTRINGMESVLDFLEGRSDSGSGRGPILESWWREPILLLVGYLSIVSPQTAEEFLRLLAGIGTSARKKKKDLPPEVIIACAEAATAALVEWPTVSESTRRDLDERLLHLIHNVEFMKKTRPSVRADFGKSLGRLGDKRFDESRWFLPADDSLGFIKVPEGPFTLGSIGHIDRDAFHDEFPPQNIFLPEFYLAKFPVTVQQYRLFTAQKHYNSFAPDWVNQPPNYPVTYVNFEDCMAYAQWLQEHLLTLAQEQLSNHSESLLWKRLVEENWLVTLPSEVEWEKAARGSKYRIYPWGDIPDKYKANTVEAQVGSVSAVGCFPNGAGPYGHLDMCGNVWEWTRSCFATYPYLPLHPDREDPHSISERVIRGGSYYYITKSNRVSIRYKGLPKQVFHDAGFRVAIIPPDITAQIKIVQG